MYKKILTTLLYISLAACSKASEAPEVESYTTHNTGIIQSYLLNYKKPDSIHVELSKILFQGGQCVLTYFDKDGNPISQGLLNGENKSFDTYAVLNYGQFDSENENNKKQTIYVIICYANGSESAVDFQAASKSKVIDDGYENTFTSNLHTNYQEMYVSKYSLLYSVPYPEIISCKNGTFKSMYRMSGRLTKPQIFGRQEQQREQFLLDTMKYNATFYKVGNKCSIDGVNLYGVADKNTSFSIADL